MEVLRGRYGALLLLQSSARELSHVIRLHREATRLTLSITLTRMPVLNIRLRELPKGLAVGLVSTIKLQYIYNFIDENIIFDVAAVLAVSLASASYIVGSVYPPTTIQMLNPPIAPPAPALGTEEAAIYTKALEEKLQNLDLVKELRQREGTLHLFSIIHNILK